MSLARFNWRTRLWTLVLGFASWLAPAFAVVLPDASTNELVALRNAIADLTATFGDRYPGGRSFLARLDAMGQRNLLPREDFENLRHEALIANPLVNGRPLLYVVRNQYRPDHHNTETMFQTGECNTGSYEPGGPLKTIDLGRNGETRVVADPGPDGRLRDPDVYFDGKRIVFAMRKNIRDNYHLYEINADGTGLKTLTCAEGVFDIDLLYLPDDSILFTSSREPKYCMCNIHIMGNLYRMEADGANIHQIGKSTLMEGHGSLLPDGRVIYYRWEYVDRNFGNAQGLWTANPDGTSHALYYGNNTPAGASCSFRAPSPRLRRSSASWAPATTVPEGRWRSSIGSAVWTAGLRSSVPGRRALSAALAIPAPPMADLTASRQSLRNTRIPIRSPTSISCVRA
jgi:hypothetical protein